MGGLIDISPVLSSRIAVWPGDVAFSRSVNLAIDEGANIDLSAITTTVHVGAHTDAPNHYAAGGEGISVRDLDRYYGRCLVVRVSVDPGARILPRDLPTAVSRRESVPARVLFATGSFPDPDHFNEDFCSLSPELVVWLHDRGARLVGIDTPSVDPCHDATLASHTAIAARDMAILEGVVLTHVEPGEYTLIALPLRIEGADASPVRAALQRL
ncbi:MAG: cyclase family protein [Deltaproteobacteria bacterium]|nr:cyclase family protein [Deltaproteobacteria bacterium]